MTPDLPDRDLERQLRDALRSRELAITPDDDALDRIHAGARRRQQRRTMTGAVAALTVIGLATAGIALRPANNAAVVANGGGESASTMLKSTSTSTEAATPSPASTGSLASTPASATAAPTLTATPNAKTIPAGGAPPKGFVPMSVTVTTSDASTYWVLGHAPCGDGGGAVCTALVKTTDSGKSFTEMAAPPSKLTPYDPGNVDVSGAGTISDVRFVDADNGWAYGGGLWQTTDGGASWSPVAIPGFVQQLAVASGHVWAIVTSGAGPSYDLYTATYPGGGWEKVPTAGPFGPAEPALAAHNTTVMVAGEDARGPRFVRSVDDTTFTPLASAACTPSSPNSLSATTGALWLLCGSGSDSAHGSEILLSTDDGTTWHVASSGSFGATAAIGAVDGASAILASDGKLARVSAGGSTTDVSMPAAPHPTSWPFVGFTNTKAGFAIAITDGTRQLWRTTDAGSHWAAVAVGAAS